MVHVLRTGGCALVSILACQAAIVYAVEKSAGGPAHPVKAVSSARVLIWFQASTGASPVSKIDIWYSLDRGQNYTLWKDGPAKTESPVVFEAPQDGLYGIYLVLHNEHGPSSWPPQPGTEPHRWVLVDGTVPVVQITQIKPDAGFTQNREVNIRWATSDANLPDRPISLHYRSEQTRTFQLIADQLAGTSWHRWVVPEGVSGRVTVKATARDEGGNVGFSEVNALKIEGGAAPADREVLKPTKIEAAMSQLEPQGPPRANAAVSLSPPPIAAERSDTAASLKNERDMQAWANRRATTGTDGDRGVAYGEPDAGQKTWTPAAVEAAKKKYDTATKLRDRGDDALALVRYREALKLDPNLVDARHDLASLLFVRGQYEGAETEFERVLASDPHHRSALKRLALSRVGLRKFASAREPLQRLLRLDAKNAEGWLCLGDVTLFLGDRETAREYWLKARSLSDPGGGDVNGRADKRLETYRGSSLALGE